jgi:hypothetical protein
MARAIPNPADIRRAATMIELVRAAIDVAAASRLSA